MVKVPDSDEPVTTRDRIVDAAAELTTVHGWAWVTMSKLADAVGVSRQTVYNEIGGKPALAEAMILGELARFLDLVNQAFDRHPDDLVDAIRGASQAVLEFAQDNKLLHAVVSATHSESLLGVAKTVADERITPYDINLAPDRLEAAVDMVVRVVLSHVMQPSAAPAETADDIAWIAARVLRS